MADDRLIIGYSRSSRLHYALTLPDPNRAEGSNRPPLIVFLHSIEERGRDVSKVISHPQGEGPGLATLALDAGTNNPLSSCATLSPLCPQGSAWLLLHRRVMRLIEEQTRGGVFDRRRILLTGVSMGGMGVWSLGMAHPTLFRALAPIAGGVFSPPMGRQFGVLRGLPVRVFHDRDDPSIPLRHDSWAVARLTKLGADVTLQTTHLGKHYIHEEIYRAAELFRWFLDLPINGIS